MPTDKQPLPDLHLPPLGRLDVAPFDLAEQRARFWSLARPGAALVALPWLAWKLTDLGWLGPVDAAFLLMAAEIPAVIGLAWGLVAWRHELYRERWRIRRAAVEDRLYEAGYSAVIEAWRAAPGVSEGPILVNFAEFSQKLTGLADRVNELVAGVVAQPCDQPAPSRPGGVTVLCCDAPGGADGCEVTVLDLLDWSNLPALPPPPPAAGDRLVELFVDRAVQGASYGPKAFASDCSEAEYKMLIDRLVVAGVLVRVNGRSTLSDKMVGFRSAWSAARDDLAGQFGILDQAHQWSADRLSAAPCPVA